MRADVGDHIIIRGHRVGEPNRECEVIDVRGADGTAPFVVRWSDNGHQSLLFPGADADIEHFERPSS